MSLAKGGNRVPEYNNKYYLSVRPPPFPIKGAERSVEEKEFRARARRNYFLRFARRINIPGKLRFNIALPRENSPRRGRRRERERARGRTGTGMSVGGKTAKKLAKKRKEKERNGEERVIKVRSRFCRTSPRACVRACRVGETGWLQFRGRASSAGKNADVQTRSLILVFIHA